MFMILWLAFKLEYSMLYNLTFVKKFMLQIVLVYAFIQLF